jgi:hypothetical protein
MDTQASQSSTTTGNSTPTTSEQPRRPRRSRRHRSIVHQHFTLENSRMQCMHCTMSFRVPRNGSTSVLLAHLRRCQPELLEDPTDHRPPPTAEELRVTIARMVLLCALPFSLVEAESFRFMMARITRVPMPSRDALRNEIRGMYQQGRVALRRVLQEVPGAISLAVDAWTSPNNLPFIAIVGHWITREWELRCVLLDFRLLDGTHSGVRLAEEVFGCLEELHITKRIIAVSADNASNNNTMLRELQRLTNNYFNAENGQVNISIPHFLLSLCKCIDCVILCACRSAALRTFYISPPRMRSMH